MARPRKITDPSQVEKLAAINCSYAEIASVLSVSVSTLTKGYSQHIEKGRESGKASLKRKMWDTAMQGNVTMLIWLSKQMLDYSDKKDEKFTDDEREALEAYRKYKKEQHEQTIKALADNDLASKAERENETQVLS
jgi:hypothetical protein